MQIHRSLLVGGAVMLLGLAGCGGGDATTSPTPTEVATSVAPAEPAEDDSATGCDVSDQTGSTSNTDLQAFADSQFAALDCAGGTELTAQLRALAKTAEFTTTVSDQGWTADVGEALGGVSVSIVDLDSRSVCRITVIDSPAKAKTVDCQDA